MRKFISFLRKFYSCEIFQVFLKIYIIKVVHDHIILNESCLATHIFSQLTNSIGIKPTREGAILFNEEFHSAKSGYHLASSHCSNLYMLRSQINLWFIRIQVNHNTSFKRITLSFVYFWQVIFFWAVILHIHKSNIGSISKHWASQTNNSFVRTPELQISFELFFSHVNLQQLFHILSVFSVIKLFAWRLWNIFPLLLAFHKKVDDTL